MAVDLQDIHRRHSAYQDSLLASFEQELRAIVLKAQARVFARLQMQLSITNGVIDQTPGNLRLLRNLNNLFMREMEKAGFEALTESFVREFHRTLPYLDETLEYLSKQAGRPLGPVKLSKTDTAILSSFQANTVSSLETAVESAAGVAMTRGMFTVGGLKFGALVESLTEKFQVSIGQARTIADTSMSVFYATATDRAFTKIQADHPAELKYRYSGPTDKLERRFCRHLTDVDKGYTREQIGEMDNGQIPNVMISRGGFNCRHQWILDTRELEGDSRKEPAKAEPLPKAA